MTGLCSVRYFSCHDHDIPPQPSHTYSCLLAVQTPPKHSLTKPEPIPGLPDPSTAFLNPSAAFPKGCFTDICLVSIPEAVDSTLPYPRLWHLSPLTHVFVHTLVHSAQPWCIPHNPARKYVSLLLIPCTHSHDPLVAEYWDKPFSEILVLFASPPTSSESLGFSPTFYPDPSSTPLTRL